MEKGSGSESGSRTENTYVGTVSGLGPSLDFLRLIWAVDHGLQRMSKWMESWLGITGPQRLVIRIVGKNPGIPAGKLAQVLHLHPSTLTGILQRLEARKLVERHADAKDARRALISLTPEGQQFDVATAGTIESTVDKLLAQFSPETIAAARSVLERFPTLFEDALPTEKASAKRTKTEESAP